jgi:hypothetical protein
VFERGFKSWCENVAILQRKELGLTANALLSPTTLTAHLGVEVWTPNQIPGLDPKYLRILLHADADSWSAVTLCTDSRIVIIANSSHSGGRPASDLMHELAHLIIGHEPARVDISEDGSLVLSTYNADQEQEATWLAGCLLLPREALVHIRKVSADRRSVARQYGVSVQMLDYRVRVSGVDKQFRRL